MQERAQVLGLSQPDDRRTLFIEIDLATMLVLEIGLALLCCLTELIRQVKAMLDTAKAQRDVVMPRLGLLVGIKPRRDLLAIVLVSLVVIGPSRYIEGPRVNSTGH